MFFVFFFGAAGVLIMGATVTAGIVGIARGASQPMRRIPVYRYGSVARFR